MELRELGRTGIQITGIGLGCWQFSGGRGLGGRYWPALSPEHEDEIVRVSLEGGINWFDTAEMYGGGASEAALARSLRKAGRAPGDVVVATKWNPILRRARSILDTFPERERHLDGFPVDLHQIHNPWSLLSSHRAQMEAMAELMDQGRIRAVGVSNFSARAMEASHEALARRGIPLASNQVKYSLLDRRIERTGVLQKAKALGITIIAYSPLEQGLLTGKFHEDPSLITGPRRWLPAFGRRGLEKSRPVVEALRRIAEGVGASPAEVALAWLVGFHGDAVVAIPGATKVHHARQNVGALSLQLPPEALEELELVARGFI